MESENWNGILYVKLSGYELCESLALVLLLLLGAHAVVESFSHSPELFALQ